MNMLFADTLKKLRTEKGLSQRELSQRLYVTRSTIARWENGNRLPNAAMIMRISGVLDIDVNILLAAVTESNETPNVIMVDDNKIILSGGLAVLEEVMPNAVTTGFVKPADAIEYAKANPVALAVLDIEMGNISGIDVCRELLEINPHTNVVFLTAYPLYAVDAWDTGASGFMLKPLTADGVREQLKKLRYPFRTGGKSV